MYTVRNGYRQYNIRWLIFALIGGIAIWEIQFSLSYFGAEELCAAGAGWALHLAAGIAALVAVASIVTAVQLIRASSDVAEAEGSIRDQRTHFLATQGLILSIFGMFGILAVEIANSFIFC
jgi:hypothetical protein